MKQGFLVFLALLILNAKCATNGSQGGSGSGSGSGSGGSGSGGSGNSGNSSSNRNGVSAMAFGGFLVFLSSMLFSLQ